MLIKKCLSVLLLSCLSLFAYAYDDDIDIINMVKECNNDKKLDQCIKVAEYYESRKQIDLAYKFYKKACLIDDQAKSNNTYVCAISRTLENNFPKDLFKSN
ncbi:MAG: hypothetical protein GKC53_05015 [Neisseriaceae bacterium]|nr:MAG: hypothetical protein GKC53_05015 [Neisseriaceae bacterium]